MGGSVLKAVILAAGRGTRLKPVTAGVPKPLLPVANKPILHYAIELLQAEGIVDIGVVVVEETRNEIQASLGDGSSWGVAITYIDQGVPEGTGHAVQVALPFVGEHPFVLYLGDNMLEDRLHGLIEAYRATRPHAVIGVKPVANPQAYGVIEMVGGRVTGVVEKPQKPPTNLALTGLFVFDPCSKVAFKDLPRSARNELELTDALDRIAKQNGTVLAHEFSGWWLDIGSPERLLEANQRMLDRLSAELTADKVESAPDSVLENVRLIGPAIIGTGAFIRNATVGPYVAVGPGVVLEGVTISNSIILEEASITGVGMPIVDSLIGEKARIVGARETCQFRLAGASYVQVT